MDAKPEIYSHRWYQEQLTGFAHLLNRLSAEYDAQYKATESLKLIVENQRREAIARDARIGELMARVESCEASLEKARKAYAEQKAKVNGK